MIEMDVNNKTTMEGFKDTYFETSKNTYLVLYR